MFRNNRLFVSLMLVVALISQSLAVAAQGGIQSQPIKPANPAGNDEAVVSIIKVRLVGQSSAEVEWKAKAPADVTIQGFDVKVQAELSNDQAPLSAQRSFGANDRSGIFDFKLPASGKDLAGGPKPGGKSLGGNQGGGNVGNNNTGNNNGNVENNDLKLRNCQVQCSQKNKSSAELQKCVQACLNGGGNNSASTGKSPRKFGEGNISGGGNTGGNNNGNTGGGNNNNRPILPRPTPPPKQPVVPDPVKENPVRITSLRAVITAKFATGNDLSAFREFVQPTDKVTAEMTPKSGRGSSLQVKKLVHLNEVARLAAECPAGQECFDIIAEIRGAEANGQFKVSMEVIFANGVRKNSTRTAGNLFRPIRLSVDKVSGQQVVNVLVNINGGGNREQFTKTDTRGIAILQGIGGAKK